MKRIVSVLLLLLFVLAAQSAFAADPVHGKIRVFGYEDDVTYPKSKFAPYAVALYKDHMDNRYLEYHYNKECLPGEELDEGEHVRHWIFNFVTEDGKREPFGGDFDLHLPYPSIWSAEQGAYWKWTKAYALKHYDWSAVYCDHAMFTWSNPDLDFEEYIKLFFLREDYEFKYMDFDDFGVVLHFSHNGDTLTHDVYLYFEEKK